MNCQYFEYKKPPQPLAHKFVWSCLDWLSIRHPQWKQFEVLGATEHEIRQILIEAIGDWVDIEEAIEYKKQRDRMIPTNYRHTDNYPYYPWGL
jgi:hypothetical protein